MKKVSCLILSGATALLSLSAFAGNVGWSNGPGSMTEGRYEAKFSALPATAALSAAHTPWTDTWWPSYKGGVAARWNWLPLNPLITTQTSPDLDKLRHDYSRTQIQKMFFYHLYTRTELMAMTPEARNSVMHALSAAEKFDIFNGNYVNPGKNGMPTETTFYPTVAAEWKRVNSDDSWWEGICNGWSPASLTYIEPAVREDLVNRDGIQVPFGSSDVKALLALHSTPAGGRRDTSSLGKQCAKKRVLGVEFTVGCETGEVNAGAFHLVMTNLIGLRHEGFVLDKDPTTEVWNQPVYGYRASFGPKVVVGRGKNADSAVYEMSVHTELDWADDEKPNWNPLNGTADYKFETAILNYTIELDAQDNIVGGRWISYEYGKDEDHRTYKGLGPDYLWKMRKYEFSGRFSALNQIYKPAVSDSAE